MGGFRISGLGFWFSCLGFATSGLGGFWGTGLSDLRLVGLGLRRDCSLQKNLPPEQGLRFRAYTDLRGAFRQSLILDQC